MAGEAFGFFMAGEAAGFFMAGEAAGFLAEAAGFFMATVGIAAAGLHNYDKLPCYCTRISA